MKNQLSKHIFFKHENLITSISKRPEMILPIAFFILCFIGTVLLLLPISTSDPISFLDALFTSVSASCVTGLSVLQINHDFNIIGHFIILLLIQAGGLGIMSITSIFFIIFGKRMSLSQERSTRNILEVESHDEIVNSIKLIFKYTFIVEFIGMIFLFFVFLSMHISVLESLKHAIFLSVSSFCNAGFTLHNTSIIEYNQYPAILYPIAILALLGATSPAVSVLLPQWFNGKKLPPQYIIVINTTLILVFISTIFFMISENLATMSDFSFFDKFSNSMFLSMATRTSGINAIDFSQTNIGTYLLMIILMIIGGSPGGTAGGIKTCTIGVLFMTAYNLVVGRNNIIRNKNITLETVQKALALVFMYMFILCIVILTLITTQSLPAKTLIFEAVSGLGTVGLSMGITPQLDEVGRVIIILAMFIGRVAPTMFLCYLNTRIKDTNISYPDAKITLT